MTDRWTRLVQLIIDWDDQLCIYGEDDTVARVMLASEHYYDEDYFEPETVPRFVAYADLDKGPRVWGFQTVPQLEQGLTRLLRDGIELSGVVDLDTNEDVRWSLQVHVRDLDDPEQVAA